MLRHLAIPLVLTAFLSLACGPGDRSGETPDGGACQPSCSGKQCGADGCGGTCGSCGTGETCTAGACAASSCVPSCSGKQCGPDGCGGTCGTCADGGTCTPEGTCPAKLSINCPAGQRCMYLERTGYQYTCTGDTIDSCTRGPFIGTYDDAYYCRILACQKGESTCGDQNGQQSPEVAACHACQATCNDEGTWTVCQNETADGQCVVDDPIWGAQYTNCVCQ